MMSPEETQILAERLRRQYLTSPVEVAADYVEAFRCLQPVSPVHFSCPGDPPALSSRSRFDDKIIADRLRAARKIVKGRFLGGTIGYVLAEDLALYANAFRRPLSMFTEAQAKVYEAVNSTGPLTPRQIKDETGLLNKQIAPALRRLQCAFLAYEDQIDSDWERAWYSFEGEWPEVSLGGASLEENVRAVLTRFFSVHVFATFEQVKNWSQLPSRHLSTILHEMDAAEHIIPMEFTGLGKGWLSRDAALQKLSSSAPSVFMLHKADYLVRSHRSELKRGFGNEEVLQYLLIDGRFQGAVLGHWRISAHDVSDVVLTLPKAERKERRAEVLAVINRTYCQPHSQIIRYDGKKL